MKRTIRLNESQLRSLIKESVRRILNEENISSLQMPVDIGNFHEGIAVFAVKGKGCNFIDENGTILFPDTWFGSARSFRDGFAAVGIKGKWNYINKNGEYLLKHWADKVKDFEDGHGVVIYGDITTSPDELRVIYYVDSNGQLYNVK